MINWLANPERFSSVARPVRPWLGAIAAALLAWGLALASLLVVAGALELGVRLVARDRFVAAARVFDREWTVLLDCFPSNPRGYFDLDLRDPQVRARYPHVAPARLEQVAARAPFAIETRYNRLRFREVEPAPGGSARARPPLRLVGGTASSGVRDRLGERS